MTAATRARLSLMMFLQYAVWGAWFVPFSTYLVHHGLSAWVGTIYSAQGWAAIAAPLFIGAIADQYFSAEKVMGVLHLASGLLLFALSTVGADVEMMFAATLGVLLAYMPTIALSNAVAFNAMSDVERQFPGVRVFGTIGWIVAGLVVGGLGAERTPLPLYLAGSVSLAYGLYAFTLPPVPPRAGERRTSLGTLLGLDAIREGDRSFWTLIGCALVMMIPFAFYNVYANAFLDGIGLQAAAAVQTIGQVSEVGFLLLLPLFFRVVGIKGVLLIGMLAWAVRYLLFANGFDADGPITPVLFVALALHGVCFDFVIVAATIWIDKRFPPETRGRAQSFLALVTWGAGYILGSLGANLVFNASANGAGQPSWHDFWLVPAGLAGVTALAFWLLFRDRTRPSARAEAVTGR